jgi:adhesin transport system outer membrane protein
MKTKRNLLTQAAVTVALCVCGAGAQAQSFTDVVQSALTIYPSLISAKAKTDAARSDIERARAAHFPQLSMGLARNSYGSGKLPETSSVKSNAATPSARLNLWSGGRIEADARRSEALTEGSEFQEAVTRDDVAQLAAEAYINWARTLEMADLAKRNLESHQVTLSDIRKIVDVDSGRRIDLEQAQVRMDNAKLIKLQRDTELAQARQRLSRFWTERLPTTPSGLTESLRNGGRLYQVPRSIDELQNGGLEDLPAIAQQRAQVQAAQAAVDMAKGLYWPTVDLSVTRQPNPFNVNARSEPQMDTFTQIQLNMPLYNGGSTSAQIQTSVSQLQAAQFALEEARLLAREKAGLAWHEWSSARDRATQGAEQARVGEKVVDGYRQQFRLARRQLLDLLNIQAEAFGYQSAATSAYYDEQIARTRLLASMGDLARRFAP